MLRNRAGNRIKGTAGGVTTTYIGNYFEWTAKRTRFAWAIGVANCHGSTMKKYYYVGAVRIGMKAGATLSYLLGDHLGSTTITTSSSGAFSAELRYKPWGETRNPAGTTPTTFRKLWFVKPQTQSARTERDRAVLLQRPLVRQLAGTVHLPGYHRAGAGESAGVGPVCVRAQ